MPLKPLPYRLVKRKLEKARFTIVSQQGSHVGKTVGFIAGHLTERYDLEGELQFLELIQ